jgi:hypothetical protein
MPAPPPGGDRCRRAAWPRLGRRASHHRRGGQPRRGNTWSYAKLDNPIGKWAWVGWSFTWENVTPGQYTLRCRAKDERGNTSKDDDSVHDYYAMDITKAQYVDVNVYLKDTLKVGNRIECPVQFPSL